MGFFGSAIRANDSDAELAAADDMATPRCFEDPNAARGNRVSVARGHDARHFDVAPAGINRGSYRRWSRAGSNHRARA
jgi:hypothetical protein